MSESMTTTYRNRVQEIENLKAENEVLRNVRSKETEDLRKANNQLAQSVEGLSTENKGLKQENAELKQQREMFQTRCELLEREKYQHKKRLHIVVIIVKH